MNFEPRGLSAETRQALYKQQHVAFTFSPIFDFIDAFADQKHAQSTYRFRFQRQRSVDIWRCQGIVRASVIAYFNPQIGASESKADLNRSRLTGSIAIRDDVGQVFLKCDM